MEFSKIANGIQPNIFAVLEEKRREFIKTGKRVINFSVGTPDFLPDEHVVKALSEAASDPKEYGYSLLDSKELVDCVKRWYKRRFDVTLEDDEITSVNGTQEGMAHAAFPLINPGDTVIITNPGYPIFEFGPMLAGAKFYYAPLLKENNFLIDFDSIPKRVAKKAKMIVVSYPNNPVTAMAPDSFYQKLIQFAKQYNLFVIHDNAYSEIAFERPCGSFLQYPGAKEVGIEFNSLSKSYNLTGARISFALGNKTMISQLKKVRTQIDYGVFKPIQKAAIAALDGPQDILERNCKGYYERMKALTEGFTEIGWEIPCSSGTMFVWAPLPKGYTDSSAFAVELLEKTGVMCVPGSSFGSLGEGYVRFALTQDIDSIKEAALRIQESGMLG